jgi:hypothetical protein
MSEPTGEIMPAERISIYLPDRLRAIVDAVGNTPSARIAAIVDRYGFVMRVARPTLLRNEWLAIFDVCNGWASWAETGETLMLGLSANVEDAIEMEGLAEKWQLPDKGRQLVQRLRALTPVEQIAVVECAERFWQMRDLNTDEALRSLEI